PDGSVQIGIYLAGEFEKVALRCQHVHTPHDTRVVHQHIQLWEAVAHLLDKLSNCRGIRDVAANSLDAWKSCCSSIQLTLISAGDNDRVRPCQQLLCKL